MLIEGSDEFLACREYSDVVHERSRISQTAASVGSDNDLIHRHVLDCCARRHLEAMLVEPVSAKTRYGCELIAGMEGIFSEHTCVCKVCDSLFADFRKHDTRPCEILVITVEGAVESYCELM